MSFEFQTMFMTIREQIISNYIDGYNQFDIDKMVKDFDSQVVFENISNGETNMRLEGIDAFEEQAAQAKNYLTTRTQIITSYSHQNAETAVEINYHAIVAVDLPNGLRKGDELQLSGKSIFTFSGNKIIKLTDIS